MRILRVFAALITAVAGFSIASPVSSQIVPISGQGVATGYLTTYSCFGPGPFPSAETCPASGGGDWGEQIDFHMDVDLSGATQGACLGISPQYYGTEPCGLTIGVPQQVWFVDPYMVPFQLQGEGFLLTYLGQDASGQYQFQGSDWIDYQNHYCGPYSGCDGYSYSYSADTFSVAPVPEPATWVMMLLGLAGIGWLTRTSRAPRRCEKRLI